MEPELGLPSAPSPSDANEQTTYDAQKLLASNADGCIFCDIVRGKLPSYKVFENEHVLSFLDIHPCSKGHTLVIPKAHHPRVDTMPADVAMNWFQSIPLISKAVLYATGAEDFNLINNNGVAAGQVVFHSHLHIIPRYPSVRPRMDRHGLRWLSTDLVPEEGVRLAEKMKEYLQRCTHARI
eukprot:GILK01006459.1.p1 GENE.GILK01006459.1~~GILK01006459.1.p1  ORF type:complete len:181 (+),score=29.13 GILK01006459.1:55-597(+)